jgi:hypothetical protein
VAVLGSAMVAVAVALAINILVSHICVNPMWQLAI